MTRIYLGRYVYGAAAIAFGIITLVWHDFNGWQQIRPLGNVPHREILVYLAVAIELFGGISILWARTSRAGALALGAIYLVFALLWLPHIVATPRVYDPWGNFFEQFSIVSGALIVYGSVSRSDPARAARLGPDRLHLFGNLRHFIHTRATRVSLWNGTVRSKVDSSRTNVLGDHHNDCVGARGDCAIVGTCSPARVTITYGDADRLRIAGMVTEAFC